MHIQWKTKEEVVAEAIRIAGLKTMLAPNNDVPGAISYSVYYQINPNFFDLPKEIVINHSHKEVMVVQALNKDDVFKRMQGEYWSPEGEARDLIMGLDLCHTSMSVGDVVRNNETEKYYVCAMAGWEEIKRGKPKEKILSCSNFTC